MTESLQYRAPAVTARLRVPPRPISRSGELVSIVIPAYNYRRFLRTAVSSALDQRGVMVEVIIVNDASTDGSAELADELASGDSRVQALHHETNRGPVDTFNDGLGLATGEYVVRLDADDLLTPGSLERSVAVAQAFPTVGLVYGRPVHFRGQPPRSHRDRPTAWVVTPGSDWLEARCRDANNVITSPEVLMRRSVVDKVGGQRQLKHTHDMEMWLRLAAASDVAYVCGSHQAWHREHPDSFSEGAADSLGLEMMRERRDAFSTLFDGRRVEIPGAEELEELSQRALALHAVWVACHEFDRGRATEHGTQELVDFAVDTWPSITGLEAWARLQTRRDSPSHWLRRHPWLALGAIGTRTRHFTAMRRWRRAGVFGREEGAVMQQQRVPIPLRKALR